MSTEPMTDYIVKLRISASCPADAEELINDYTGEETDVEILEIREHTPKFALLCTIGINERQEVFATGNKIGFLKTIIALIETVNRIMDETEKETSRNFDDLSEENKKKIADFLDVLDNSNINWCSWKESVFNYIDRIEVNGIVEIAMAPFEIKGKKE
jgi:hypothetical protein